MRVILFTGKGGVGKTTVSAATATLAAVRGLKTLVLSTDPAHSLADTFGHPLGPEPVELDHGLYGQQVDTQRRFEQTWRQVQSYLLDVLAGAGVDPLQAEELTVLPGAEEVLALLEVRNQVRSGPWDVVVVDCAPTAETLRLLALPEALSRYVDRIFPIERRLMRQLRPVFNRMAGLPMPGERVLAAVERLHRELGDVRSVLTDGESASVRLVLTPEAVVVAEARRTLTSLSLYGYRADAVVANRIFPAGADRWMAGWVRSQAAQLAEIEHSFAPLPIYRAPYRPAEPVGLGELTLVAEQTYGDADPLALPAGPGPLTVRRDGDEFDLLIALPHAAREDVTLARRGDELVLTVAGRRRVTVLPSALRRCDVVDAALRGGSLRVRFRPDPAVWMST